MKKGFLVGSVAKFSRNKGWFFGHFMSEPLLRNDDLEIAWQDISNKKSALTDRHYHKKALELTVVISGELRLKIDNIPFTLKKGEFSLLYPEAVVSEVSAGQETTVLVIKAPSIPDDKFPVK